MGQISLIFSMEKQFTLDHIKLYYQILIVFLHPLLLMILLHSHQVMTRWSKDWITLLMSSSSLIFKGGLVFLFSIVSVSNELLIIHSFTLVHICFSPLRNTSCMILIRGSECGQVRNCVWGSIRKWICFFFCAVTNLNLALSTAFKKRKLKQERKANSPRPIIFQRQLVLLSKGNFCKPINKAGDELYLGQKKIFAEEVKFNRLDSNHLIKEKTYQTFSEKLKNSIDSL